MPNFEQPRFEQNPEPKRQGEPSQEDLKKTEKLSKTEVPDVKEGKSEKPPARRGPSFGARKWGEGASRRFYNIPEK